MRSNFLGQMDSQHLLEDRWIKIFDLGEVVSGGLNGITQIPFDWRASTSESIGVGSRRQDHSCIAMWPSVLGRQFDAKVQLADVSGVKWQARPGRYATRSLRLLPEP